MDTGMTNLSDISVTQRARVIAYADRTLPKRLTCPCCGSHLTLLRRGNKRWYRCWHGHGCGYGFRLTLTDTHGRGISINNGPRWLPAWPVPKHRWWGYRGPVPDVFWDGTVGREVRRRIAVMRELIYGNST